MFIDEYQGLRRGGRARRQGRGGFSSRSVYPQRAAHGGNGGRGGDVILEADHDLNNLINQFYNSRLIAESGEAAWARHGWTRRKDVIIKVPCRERSFGKSTTPPQTGRSPQRRR